MFNGQYRPFNITVFCLILLKYYNEKKILRLNKPKTKIRYSIRHYY